MTHYRIIEAAELTGVSDDSIRRWAADGTLEATTDDAGVQVVSGASLAKLLVERAPDRIDKTSVVRSARNQFTGIVTTVKVSGLVAQVELQAGPHRVVSLMTSEACAELGIEVGSRATAIVKATNVIVETEGSKK